VAGLVAVGSREELKTNPGLAVGTLAVTAEHVANLVDTLLPKTRPVVPVHFSSADEHLRRIRELRQPSVIAVVSGSEAFLNVARSLLVPAVGRRHSLSVILLPAENASLSRSADLIFCDSIAKQAIRSHKAIEYRLIRPDALAYAASAMQSYQ